MGWGDVDVAPRIAFLYFMNAKASKSRCGDSSFHRKEPRGLGRGVEVERAAEVSRPYVPPPPLRGTSPKGEAGEWVRYAKQ